MGVVQVHALVPLFDEHGLNLLGGVDAVVEDEGFGAFGFLFISVQQFLLHEVIAVQPFRTAHGVIAVDANLQRAQVDVVAVGDCLGEEFLLYERRDGLTDDEFIVVVLERQLDVGTQWCGGNAEDDLVRKVPKQLTETVVVGLIDYDQSQVFKLNALVVQSVVQRFDHGHEAPVIVFLVELLDFAVDDFVRNADFRQHAARLPAQFDAVRQNQYALARIQNVPLRQFGEDDRLSASCWQLEQQIVAVRKFLHPRHERIDGIFLVPVEVFPFVGFQLFLQLEVGQ